MIGEQVNRVGSVTLIVLAVAALGLVLFGSTQPPQPLPHDEGPLARLFQLVLATQVVVGLLVFATADWRRPGRVLRPLLLAAGLTALALLILSYLERQ